MPISILAKAALAALSLSLAVAAPVGAHDGTGHEPVPPHDPQEAKKEKKEKPCKDEYREVKGQGRSCRVEGGLWKVRLRSGETVQTHGLDAGRAGSGQSFLYSTSATPRQPTCAGTHRFRAIIAVPPEGGDRTVASFREEINKINGVFHHAAVESGSPGGASLRFVCDSTGQVRVDVVRLSTPNTQADFDTIVSELRDRYGYRSTVEKYAVYYDAQPATTDVCGIGTMWPDDRDLADNDNNIGPDYAVAFDYKGGCLIHELGHTLGAVQAGAPHSTGTGGHCWESWDVMCYNDGGSTDSGTIAANCPDFDHFDCRHDSYFDAKIGSQQGGVAGSYIDTHWNIGDCYARWVANAACSDSTPPTVTIPAQSLATGSKLGASGAAPVRVSWSGSDAGSGVASYSLWQSTDGGAYVQVPLPSATTTSVVRSLEPGRNYRFVTGAVDGAGNRSAWTYGTTFAATAHQEASTAVAYAGTWNRLAWSPASGGYMQSSTQAGATAKLSFTGRSVGWSAARAANRGQAQVFVDGAFVKTVDLYAASTVEREVVFSREWASSGAHTLTVKVLGTSGRPTVDVDAFAVLR